jgi:LacI family transcriptional regulator
MDINTKLPATGRATIKTVAAHAGVSVAAVSKVLRNAYGVSEALRSKVQASIVHLDYRPNVSARGMRGQTFKVGVILLEIANPFLSQIMDGVHDVLAASNYQALMGLGESQMPLEASLVESMIDFNMDGLILVAPQMGVELLDKYARQIPMVVIGHHEPTAMHFDTVNSDDQEGAAIAVRAFIDRGMTDIGMLSRVVGGPVENNVVHQREIGFHKALAKAGLPAEGRVWQNSRYVFRKTDEVENYLMSGRAPRAVFCWSDIDGISLVNYAIKNNIRVPEDIAIIGYDNTNVAALTPINLASIDQSGRRIGSLATETLLSRIAGRTNASHLLIEPTLVERSSLTSKP